MAKLKYRQLGSVQVKDNRNVVISETYLESGEIVGYSVTEQLTVNEGEKETKVFLKNGLGILPKESLVRLSETLSKIISEEIETK